MKLGDHKHSKVTELDFSGRFSFAQKRAKRSQNGLNMEFFINFSKLCHYFFLRLGDHKHSKVTELDFSGRFSFAQKMA